MIFQLVVALERLLLVSACSFFSLIIKNDIDQFLRIESGKGLCQMEPTKDNLNFEVEVSDDDAILVLADMWHNVTNTGDEPLKLYTLYADLDHLLGTVHVTHQEAKDYPNKH